MGYSDWFLQALEDYRNGEPTLPTPPFQLHPWVGMLPGAYEVMEREVKQAIAFKNKESSRPCPRFESGALLKDLKRLYELSFALQLKTFEHTCHAVGCDAPIESHELMCSTHWEMVPSTIKKEICWRYEPGQKKTKVFSSGYLHFAHEAIVSVAHQEGLIASKAACPECLRQVTPIASLAAGSVTVANINTHPEVMQKPNSVYVGRHNSKRGLRQSPLHNPFSIGRDGDRDQVCEKCLERVIKPALETRQGAVWMELDKLSDRLLNGESLTLVCYCVPERCHAMDIANALNKLVLEKKGVASPVVAIAPSPAPTPIAHPGGTS